MVRRIASICLVAVAATTLAVPASAEGSRGYKADRDTPVKDCTRINGRFGYYGNPWCTPAEQARWDRWSSGKRWIR